MFDGLKDKFVNLIMSREFVMILLLFLCGGTLIYRVFDLQIVNGEPIAVQGELHGLIGLLQLDQAGVGCAVGIGQGVHAEAAVVGPFAEVAAVGVVLLTVFFLHQAMVGPLPDAAAHQLGIGLEGLPVGFQQAGALTHGVAVFALEQGLFRIAFRVVLHERNIGVHAAGHVGGEGFLFPLVTLIVNGPGGIDFADGLGHGLMAAAVAGFVAQAPHENAGVVAVAHHHAHAAVHELGLPFRVLGDVVVVADVGDAVALDVRFIHHIQTILVAKIQEARVVGIMAGADGVHVVPLHEQHVLFHVVDGGIEAQQRMSVVAVHAQELDVFTVEVEHAVLDFDFLEAHIHPLGLTGDFGNQLIPMGRFRRPGLHVFDFSRQPRFAADHVAELREHRFFAVQQR